MVNLKKLLDKMTVEEKIGQLVQYNGNLFLKTEAEITGPEKELGLTKQNLNIVGNVLNFAYPEEMIKIQDEHLRNDPNKIPMLFMMDVIHGYQTMYPVAQTLSCSFDPDIFESCAKMAAKESAAGGIHVTFSPMVDYAKDSRWGRVIETCGEEPLLMAKMQSAAIKGYQGKSLSDDDSIATCVKHFACYGNVEAGRDYNQSNVSPYELYQYYLPAYKACLDAGSPMVMTSFQSLNGIPSTGNIMLKKILRDDWKFDGVLISDYNAVSELISHGIASDDKQAALLSFNCECDIEMCTTTYIRYLKQLIEDGQITMQQLDKSVMRVLKLKQDLGLFENPYHGANPELLKKLVCSKEHRNIARKAAEESAVLLKNENVLPFNNNVKNIALVGPFADNKDINGSARCNCVPTETVTVYEGIKSMLKNSNVSCAKGCEAIFNNKDTSDFDKAISLARENDVVILCLGEPQTYIGEGKSRTDIRLPGMQVELARRIIEVNKNTVIVLFNGRGLDITSLDEIAPSILEVGYPGTEGGNAIANLLFGKVNPSGKLTRSYPRSVGQCPIYYNRTMTGRPHFTNNFVSFGYSSDYIDCPTLPLYKFGYGLSYSKFEYIDMLLSNVILKDFIEITVILRNNSNIAGKEVVQLYMNDPIAKVVRPVQQLIDFKKINLLPQEQKEVKFIVKKGDLGYYDFDGNFIVEDGDINFMVGYADNFVFTKKVKVISD